MNNRELNEMVKAYQANPDEFLYMDIHEAVYPMAEAVAYGYYHDYKWLNIPADEFTQCARIAIFKSIDKYDIEKGSNFTSLVKQLTKWTINDEILKKVNSKANSFYSECLYLDKPLSSTDGTFLDAIEYQVSTDKDQVFNAIVEEVEPDMGSLKGILTGLVQEFSADASEDDAVIIKTWVTTLLTLKDSNIDVKKVVNKALELAMPAVASATIRKKKGRAEKRFNTFAQEKGFSSFCLSQF